MKAVFLSLISFIIFSSSLMAESVIDRYCKKFTNGYNIGYKAEGVLFLRMNEDLTEVVIRYKESYKKEVKIKIIETTYKKQTLSYYKRQFKLFGYDANKKGFKDTLFICRKNKKSKLENTVAFFKPVKIKD